MDTLHTILLILHITSGTLALIGGGIILFLRKGDRLHRRIGRAYVWAMFAVAASALSLALIRPNAFLFWVGIFTLYQIASGLRAVRHRNRSPQVVDIALTTLGATGAVAMLTMGQVVLWVFGGISAFLVIGDVRHFAALWRGSDLPPTAWLRRHIGFMMGAYIGTFTAFLVTNGPANGGLYVWLGPTAIGVPLLMYWGRKYSKKPPASLSGDPA